MSLSDPLYSILNISNDNDGGASPSVTGNSPNQDKDSFENERRQLHERFFEEYNSQYINYKKYYLASEYTGKKGRRADYAVTIGAAILLIMVSGVLRPGAEINQGLLLLTSAFVSGLSYATIVGGWQAKSDQLYKAGQIHQSLYSEFDKMVKQKLPDPSHDTNELKSECESLLSRKHELNQATQQVSSKWYWRLQEQKDTDWERPKLEEIRDGEADFSGDDPEMGRIEKWFKTNVTWVFF
ncbi:hypothetical protein [Haloarchaeobius sp. DYHT-AS-18]|uniref:hypothetical protein n=1 Tax=Haloarchaeobius sp. DYHT-AS-18 TaxID=3446117 RepID=UPI003EBF6EF5